MPGNGVPWFPSTGYGRGAHDYARMVFDRLVPLAVSCIMQTFVLRQSRICAGFRRIHADDPSTFAGPWVLPLARSEYPGGDVLIVQRALVVFCDGLAHRTDGDDPPLSPVNPKSNTTIQMPRLAAPS